jgi:hypothetical protein|tara:strand:+ start:146 stop:328 length:183 start_codon:yes stop_codon:yes gene_type:complete
MITTDSTCEFDVYRINISKEIGHHILDISDVISWNSIKLRMTTDELKELAKFINNHLDKT